MKFALGIITAAAIIGLVGTAAAAAAAENKRNLAIGLARIIAQSEFCKLMLDPAAVEKYSTDHGLSDPETYATMSVTIDVYKDDKPTLSQCGVAKSTAKAIGILVP